MSAISTVGMESADQVGLMSLVAYADSGVRMEVTWHSGLSLVLQLTVGGELGPWYTAELIPMGLDLEATDLRILQAARHFRRLVGVPASRPSNGREYWIIFRTIWDLLETGELPA